MTNKKYRNKYRNHKRNKKKKNPHFYLYSNDTCIPALRNPIFFILQWVQQIVQPVLARNKVDVVSMSASQDCRWLIKNFVYIHRRTDPK